MRITGTSGVKLLARRGIEPVGSGQQDGLDELLPTAPSHRFDVIMAILLQIDTG
jgi:hypothetical protein